MPHSKVVGHTRTDGLAFGVRRTAPVRADTDFARHVEPEEGGTSLIDWASSERPDPTKEAWIEHYVLSFCEETTRFRPLWRNHERAPTLKSRNKNGKRGGGAVAAITGHYCHAYRSAAPFAQDVLPQFRAGYFILSHTKHRRSPHEFAFTPVGIANPCVFDKPLMPYPAVWTVGAAEKYRGAAE